MSEAWRMASRKKFRIRKRFFFFFFLSNENFCTKREKERGEDKKIKTKNKKNLFCSQRVGEPNATCCLLHACRDVARSFYSSPEYIGSTQLAEKCWKGPFKKRTTKKKNHAIGRRCCSVSAAIIIGSCCSSQLLPLPLAFDPSTRGGT